MKTLLLLLVYSCHLCRAQTGKQLSIPTNKAGEYTLWYKWRTADAEKFKLPLLLNTPQPFYLRYWVREQAIDIWTPDNKTYYGSICSHLVLVGKKKRNGEHKPGKIFYKHVSLDTALARKAFEVWKGIADIPTQDSIEGWSQGLDGETFLFEISTPTTYTFKDYWTPYVQH